MKWFVLLGFLLAAPLSSAAQRPPNIIQIIADDLGYDDVGSFGAKDIATPNIDRLAKDGRRFTSFYAPHSTCTPTRAALLTGCYAPRVGLPNVLFPNSRIGLNKDEVTVAELLKGRGYATAAVGKWHLGHLPEFLPLRHGFDLFFGIPYPNDHVPERLEREGTGKSRGFPPMPLIRGENIIEQPAQLASLPERFCAEAVKFIQDNKDRPFFLHYSNIETHTPWLVNRPFLYKSKAGVYGDAVQCLDWAVGQLVDAVKAAGIENETLIVFTSDNGPLVHRYPELEGIYGHAAAVDTERRHVLREGKYQARYEGGTRVACIARWTGRIPAGTTNSELIAGFDFYTTFAKLAGAEIPTDRVVDGKDIAPLLLAQPGAKSPHDAFYYYQGLQLAAVRSGDWKLVFPAGMRRIPELYNVVGDLGETRNVREQNPDVAARLQAFAERAREDLGDGMRPGKNRRSPGRVE